MSQLIDPNSPQPINIHMVQYARGEALRLMGPTYNKFSTLTHGMLKTNRDSSLSPWIKYPVRLGYTQL